MNSEPTVLVVDDNRVNRRLLAAILEKDGYVVLEADDGGPGVEIAQEKRPDLILLDIMMPVVDGFAA
ncbi:MAG: response regulator [Candidatus Binatia bacterium]|nr:response regulator [Candidatus Binatia bacterium]